MGTNPPEPRRGPDSRILILLLLVGAAVAALLPVIVAHSRRAQTMRADLSEVVSECRALYAAASTAADTAAADSVRPALHGVERPADPACGPYRRRNMTKPLRP
jgi:type II secretory pathway pseudopilin PulG